MTLQNNQTLPDGQFENCERKSLPSRDFRTTALLHMGNSQGKRWVLFTDADPMPTRLQLDPITLERRGAVHARSRHVRCTGPIRGRPQACFTPARDGLAGNPETSFGFAQSQIFGLHRLQHQLLALGIGRTCLGVEYTMRAANLAEKLLGTAGVVSTFDESGTAAGRALWFGRLQVGFGRTRRRDNWNHAVSYEKGCGLS